MTKKVLITGGAGFIGSRLVRRFLSRDSLVPVVLDDFSTGKRANLEGVDVRVIEDTILDRESLRSAMKGCQQVVHLAAIPSVSRSVMNPMASHDANATGSLNVLEASREAGATHVVVASSSSVYGDNEELPKREVTHLLPKSPYAVSKLATEAYAQAYTHSYGLPTLSFRFFNVFGPGQAASHDYAAVIPKWISSALMGMPLIIEGDGSQSRDFTFVDTVCDTIIAACEREISSTTAVNLAFGTRTSLLELISELERAFDKQLQTEFVAPRAGDVRHSQADPARMRELFPEVQPVPLGAGLRRTIEWLRESSQ